MLRQKLLRPLHNLIVLRYRCGRPKLTVLMVALSFGMAPFSFAANESGLRGPEILQILSGMRVVGNDFEQTFGDPRGHLDAPTTYWQGNNSSFGRWKVIADQYCSLWPQSSRAWSCYDMLQFIEDGVVHVVWVSGTHRYEGRVTKR